MRVTALLGSQKEVQEMLQADATSSDKPSISHTTPSKRTHTESSRPDPWRGGVGRCPFHLCSVGRFLRAATAAGRGCPLARAMLWYRALMFCLRQPPESAAKSPLIPASSRAARNGAGARGIREEGSRGSPERCDDGAMSGELSGAARGPTAPAAARLSVETLQMIQISR